MKINVGQKITFDYVGTTGQPSNRVGVVEKILSPTMFVLKLDVVGADGKPFKTFKADKIVSDISEVA